MYPIFLQYKNIVPLYIYRGRSREAILCETKLLDKEYAENIAYSTAVYDWSSRYQKPIKAYEAYSVLIRADRSRSAVEKVSFMKSSGISQVTDTYRLKHMSGEQFEGDIIEVGDLLAWEYLYGLSYDGRDIEEAKVILKEADRTTKAFMERNSVLNLNVSI